MPALLASVDMKLRRAEAQVIELGETIQKNQLKIVTRSEILDDRCGYRLILDSFENVEQLDDWGLRVGEIVHNARSALDNLAFALARLKADPPPNPRAIAFPICGDAKRLSHPAVQGCRAQLTDKATEIVKKLQPFHRDDPSIDPLLHLSRINNDDKHRVPRVVAVVPQNYQFSAQLAFYSEEEAAPPHHLEVWDKPLTPSVVILTVYTKHRIEKVSGNFNIVTEPRLDGTNEPLVPYVQKLAYYPRMIVEQFRSMF